MPQVEILKQYGYHFLWIDGALWMWDLPEEVACQEEIAQQAFGDVLVAGYGLGLVQRELRALPAVHSVHTIESREEVLRECERVYGRLYGTVGVGDFFTYSPERRFDCVIGDVWQDAVFRCLQEYTRFKERAKILLKDGGKVLAWGQDYMEYLIRKEVSGD